MKIRLSYLSPDYRELHNIIEFEAESQIQHPGTADIEGKWFPCIEGVPLKGPFFIESNRLSEHGRFIIEFKEEKTDIKKSPLELAKELNKAATENSGINIGLSTGEPKTVASDFWQYLVEEAGDTDHYWLDTWLEEKLEDYNEETPCPVCNSKRSYQKTIRSKKGRWLLETHTKCKNCKHQLSINDNRPELRKALQKGNILNKDIETLEKALKEE